MPRGELSDYILLCSYEDTNRTLHGLGMRKMFAPLQDNCIRIEIAPVAASTFSKYTGIIISADVEVPKVLYVSPELSYVHAKSEALSRFKDSDDVKDSISLLLEEGLRHTLNEYYGFCLVQIPGTTQARPSFVFISTNGQYTALTTMTRMPAVAYVNYLQPALRGRTFWRASCFEPLPSQPKIVTWAKDIDVTALITVVTSCVLTFNALNCSHEFIDDEAEEESTKHLPHPYAREP